MCPLRFLVIENDPKWQRVLRDVLRRLGGEVEMLSATTHSEAAVHISSQEFDLATVDLSLLSDPIDRQRADDKGMELVGMLRESPLNRNCGLIVLTGYPTTASMRQALRDYYVYDYVEKDAFDPDHFLEVVRDALFDKCRRCAEDSLSQSYQLDITLGPERLLSSELKGPDRQSTYTAEGSPLFDGVNLIRRSDNLNMLLREGGPELWRPEANDIGKAVCRVLAGEQQIWGDFKSAQGLAKKAGDLWLRFIGPAPVLGIPFELMRDENDYFGHVHVIMRRLIQPTSVHSRKVEPFHAFISELRRHKTQLRVLIVGANSDGLIPAVDVESAALKTLFVDALQSLGIPHEVVLLIGTNAHYDNVRRALSDGRFHVFHFAGHGRYNSRLPEVSGLILTSPSGLREITAAELNLLTRDKELRLVFLNCCLGARTAHQSGRGDFYGVLEALARADVPLIVSHRWRVADAPASMMAQVFYKQLWCTLLPAVAMLRTRLAAMHEMGRDDATWASPVFLMQNL
jgi:CheY-like chemotaxis protein